MKAAQAVSGIEARDVAHRVRSRRSDRLCKRRHGQFLSILAEKQPRVALCAWIVSIVGLANSLRMPASASPGWVRIASAIIPSLIEAAQRQHARLEHRRDLVDDIPPAPPRLR